MLVIVDANVFVSAAIAGGASNRIVTAWLGGGDAFDIVMCPRLLAEVTEVLTTRPRLRKWISLDEAWVFIRTIRALVELVPDPEVIEAATRDPGDDYLVALGRAHDVEVIVTGDKDLLEWPEQRPPAVAPSDFEKQIVR